VPACVWVETISPIDEGTAREKSENPERRVRIPLLYGTRADAPVQVNTTAPPGAHEEETMLRMQRNWGRSMLAAASAVLLATACGGGDKSPTGPGNGGDDNAITGEYELVQVGRDGLPTEVQIEDCIPTQFFEGRLRLEADGTWKLGLHLYDDNYGDAGYLDEGQYERNGSTVRLYSVYYDATFQARLDDGEVSIMYDWCENGVPDLQFVFDR
jgi:hypothetical protein